MRRRSIQGRIYRVFAEQLTHLIGRAKLAIAKLAITNLVIN
jgi:hypothetical protein